MEIGKADDHATVEKFWLAEKGRKEFIDHKTGNNHHVVRCHRDIALWLVRSREDFCHRLRIAGLQGQNLTMVTL